MLKHNMCRKTCHIPICSGWRNIAVVLPNLAFFRGLSSVFDLREKYLSGNTKKVLFTCNFVSLKNIERNELIRLRMYQFLIRRTATPKTVLGFFFMFFWEVVLNTEYTLGNEPSLYLESSSKSAHPSLGVFCSVQHMENKNRALYFIKHLERYHMPSHLLLVFKTSSTLTQTFQTFAN